MFGFFGKKGKKSTAPTEPQNPTDYDSLVEKAAHHVHALQSAHQQSWGFGKADRFEVDFDAGLISFIFEDEKVAIAPVELIGTWSAAAQEFLWAWDHPMCPPANNAAACIVKTYAETHDIDQLKNRTLSCDGDDGWSLASIACLLGDLQGVYRTPNGDNLVYLGFGNIHLSSIS